jgi:hypothetical protein
MLGFHVLHGVAVPIGARDFLSGLDEQFAERDGMYFLPDQVREYDVRRIRAGAVQQLALLVTDEASAVQWLRQQLGVRPQSFQDLQPQFMREVGGWQKYEKQLDLAELLYQNFLEFKGQGDVPAQIHGYLSSNFHELRNLSKDEPALRAKAKGRWYVPDSSRAADIEQAREKGLLREFEEYRAPRQGRLPQVRLEAIRAGFHRAWQDHDYRTILDVASKLPDVVIQEDPKLLRWYDGALTRTEAV